MTKPLHTEITPKRIAIMGSTGSIGTQALEVIKENPEHFEVEVLESFKAMRPFFNYMSDVLTTNLNGESII
mgnify:CR=1 FL=1